MKKYLFIIPLLFLFSCMGEDGQDGNSYVALTWTGTILYEDDIPSTPVASSLRPDYYYSTSPGSYSYSYIHEINPSVLWEANLRVVRDLGTEGSFMQDGYDGDDNYYKIGLWSFGPEIYKTHEPLNTKKSEAYYKEMSILQSEYFDMIPLTEKPDLSKKLILEKDTLIFMETIKVYHNIKKYLIK